MQAEMDSFSAACNNFGLTISTKKTEVMFQPAPSKRSVGGQRKRFKDSLKVNISTESWESLASYKLCWRHNIIQGAKTAEERRSLQAELKRAARKDSANQYDPYPLLHDL